jgi:hypothetical protein
VEWIEKILLLDSYLCFTILQIFIKISDIPSFSCKCFKSVGYQTPMPETSWITYIWDDWILQRMIFRIVICNVKIKKKMQHISFCFNFHKDFITVVFFFVVLKQYWKMNTTIFRHSIATHWSNSRCMPSNFFCSWF